MPKRRQRVEVARLNHKTSTLKFFDADTGELLDTWHVPAGDKAEKIRAE